MAPVKITAEGVGSYAPRGEDGGLHIEAEHFFALTGGARKSHTVDGRFGVTVMDGSATLRYPHVRGIPCGPNVTLTLRAANGGSRSRVVVVRVEEGGGDVLCRAVVAPTGGWEEVTSVPCPLLMGIGERKTGSSLVLSLQDGGEEGEAGEKMAGEPRLWLDSFLMTG